MPALNFINILQAAFYAKDYYAAFFCLQFELVFYSSENIVKKIYS